MLCTFRIASCVCSLFSWISLEKGALVRHADGRYLRVCVGESLFELAFGLDSGIFHVLEVLTHILHLVLELGQVRVIPRRLLYHF